MVISIMGILLYAKVSPLYNVLRKWLCCCLQINYLVYKHFDMSVHIKLSDATCVQNFKPVTLTAFEILGFKLKNENTTTRRIGEIAMFVVQFSPKFR